MLAASGGARMSAKDTYLAVFLSNKTSPRWRAWYAMSEEERRAKDVEGLAALKAWDESHRDAIVYMGPRPNQAHVARRCRGRR
jgi:hypothetical protein